MSIVRERAFQLKNLNTELSISPDNAQAILR